MTGKQQTVLIGAMDYVIVGVVLAVLGGIAGLIAGGLLSMVVGGIIGFLVGAFLPLLVTATAGFLGGRPVRFSQNPVDDLASTVRSVAAAPPVLALWRLGQTFLKFPHALIGLVLGGGIWFGAIVLSAIPTGEKLRAICNNALLLSSIIGLAVIAVIAGTIVYGFEVALYFGLIGTPIFLIASIVLSITPVGEIED